MVSTNTRSVRPIDSTYRFEHFETGNSQTFRSPVHPAILRALERPSGTSTGVQEDTDEEQVHQPPALFGDIHRVIKSGQKVGYPIPTSDAEVLIAAMTRNAGKGSVVVALR